MPTDPFVPTSSDDAPRHEQNFAPGTRLPPARGWRADRPGEVLAVSPAGGLSGTPGPNVGFALMLARRARDRLCLEPGEHGADAVAVVAELAMKRAAALGRAPVNLDVDFAIDLLGYAAAAPADVQAWRPRLVRGADHDYVVRRAIADSVTASVLRLSAHDLPHHLLEVRAGLAGGVVAEVGVEPNPADGPVSFPDELPPPSAAPLADDA